MSYFDMGVRVYGRFRSYGGVNTPIFLRGIGLTVPPQSLSVRLALGLKSGDGRGSKSRLVNLSDLKVGVGRHSSIEKGRGGPTTVSSGTSLKPENGGWSLLSWWRSHQVPFGAPFVIPP